MYCYLLELDAWPGAGVETLRLATHTVVTGPRETPANAVYDGRIVDPGSIARTLFSGGVFGRSSTSYGYIEAANADGRLDPWLDYGFDGRAFALKALPAPGMPVSAARTLFRGTLAGIDGGDARRAIRLLVRDRLAELAVPLLTERYVRTQTGVDLGGAGFGPARPAFRGDAGEIKPRAFGSVVNVSGRTVSAADLLWQFSAGPVAEIRVYDGGVPLEFAGDYPVLSSLMAAPVAPGRYLTCKAQGLVRLGGMPTHVVTADVTEAADCSAAGVVGRMLDHLGIPAADRDEQSFAALRLFNPAPVGIYVDGDAPALDLIGQVLGSIGAAIVPTATGAFQVFGAAAPASPVGELTLADLAEGASFAFGAGPESGGVPAWSVAATYGRVWTTLSDGQVAGQAPLDRKAYLAIGSRQATAQNAAVREAHPLAPSVTADTLLANEADARAEAARLLGLYGARRDRLSWPVPADRAPYDLGQVVSVRLPRFGYAAGRPMAVVGRRDDFARRTVTLDLWG